MVRLICLLAAAAITATPLIADELKVDLLVGPRLPSAELVDQSGRRFVAVDFNWPLAITAVDEAYVRLDTDPPVAILRSEVLPIHEAAQLYHETVVKSDARNVADWLKLRGDCGWYVKLYHQSAADYLKASDLDPKNRRFALKAAEACLQAERFDKVLEVCDRTIQQDPTDAAFHYWRGRALGCLNDPLGALAAFDEAVRLDPTHAHTYACRAWTRLALRDYPAAIADARRAAELSRDGGHLLTACYAHVALCNREGAIACTRDAVRMAEPEAGMIAIHLGLLYESHREASLDATLAEHPVAQEVGYLFRARRAMLEGRLEEAFEAAETGVLLRSQFLPSFLVLRGELNLAQGNVEQSLVDANQALAEGALEDALHLRGRCHLATEDVDLAIDDFRRAEELRPDAALLLDLCEAYRRRGEYFEAHAALDRMADIDPNQIARHVARAHVLLDERQEKLAMAECSTAIDKLRTRPASEPCLLKFHLEDQGIGIGFPQVAVGTPRAQHDRLYRMAFALRSYALARQGNFTAALSDVWQMCTLPVVSN